MAKFYSAEYLAERLCLRGGDYLLRNKGIYLDCATDVFEDLNEDVLKLSEKVKIPVRYEFFVDKRTNTVLIPKKSLKLCSVSGVDRWGHSYPLYRNDSIPTDIVDIGSPNDCACENECSYQLCNTIKGYEAVQSTKSDFLPNGDPISFLCTDRKMVDKQGFFYSQTQYPLRVYLSGVWTDTVLHTEDKKLCELEVDTRGCICDTESNLKNVCEACGINESNCVPIGGTAYVPPCNSPNANEWIYQIGSTMEWFNTQCGGYPYMLGRNFKNIYNISQDGNRLIFPFNFGWDKVIIRFYEDISLNNIQVPYIAKNVFMTGLQYFSAKYHDKKQNLATLYEQRYAKEKWGTQLSLNKNTIAENAAIYTPIAFVPTYIIDNRNINSWW